MDLLLNFFMVTGINATLVILFLLNRKKNKQLPHRILIGLFVYFFFVSLHAYGGLYDNHLINVLGFLFADTIGYFAGPALLLYVQSIFHETSGFLRKNIYHFSPLLVYLLGISLPSFIYTFLEIKSDYLEAIKSYDFIFNIQAFYLLAYLGISLFVLLKNQAKLKSVYSNLEDKDLNWVKHLLIGFMAIIIFYLLMALFEHYFRYPVRDAGLYTTMLLLAMVMYLGYYGLSQTTYLLPDFLTKNEPEDDTDVPTHHLVNASESEIESLKAKLVQVFATQQPHLDPRLDLRQLAALVSTTPKKLTALLNHHLHLSFYDLVNAKRVEAVKEILAPHQQKGIIMLDAEHDNHGLFWMHDKNILGNPRKVKGHIGGNWGVFTSVWFEPKRGLGFILLSNTERGESNFTSTIYIWQSLYRYSKKLK